MKAAEAMTRNVVCVRPDDDLETIQEIMKEWDIRHMPVTSHGKLVGLISDRDILLRTTVQESGEMTVESISVSEIMTRKLFTCTLADSVAKIAKIMIDHKIDCVPIVDADRQLMGLVTSSDLLELLTDKDVLDSGRLIPWSYKMRSYGSNYRDIE